MTNPVRYSWHCPACNTMTGHENGDCVECGTKQMAHSVTPWVVNKYAGVGSGVTPAKYGLDPVIIDAGGLQDITSEDFAFLFMAVNSHDALVAVCKEACLYLLAAKEARTLVGKIRNALALTNPNLWPLCPHNRAVGACPTCGIDGAPPDEEETETVTDRDYHQFGCVCADCSGAELTSDND